MSIRDANLQRLARAGITGTDAETSLRIYEQRMAEIASNSATSRVYAVLNAEVCCHSHAPRAECVELEAATDEAGWVHVKHVTQEFADQLIVLLSMHGHVVDQADLDIVQERLIARALGEQGT